MPQPITKCDLVYRAGRFTNRGCSDRNVKALSSDRRPTVNTSSLSTKNWWFDQAPRPSIFVHIYLFLRMQLGKCDFFWFHKALRSESLPFVAIKVTATLEFNDPGRERLMNNDSL